MKTPITPGPWKYSGRFIVADGAPYAHIAEITQYNDGYKLPELQQVEANAKAITEVPEMIEILETLRFGNKLNHTANRSKAVAILERINS